jgi:hypothetical protein
LKFGRQVKIEEGWMLQMRRVHMWAPRGLYRVCQLFGGCKKASCDAAQQIKTWQVGQDRIILQKIRVLIWAPRGLCRVCQLPGGVKVHLVMQPLNARSQQNQTWQAGQDRRKLDVEKEKGSSIGPLEISTRCANFLEDVKLHLVMRPLNAESQQNKTWQAGQDRRRLDAAKKKGPHMGPLGSLQGVPTSWRM